MRVLAQHWLFAGLSEHELNDLASVVQRRSVPNGALLFSKGDPTPGLHLVERGAIKIYTLTAAGDERIVDIVGPGEVCGEMGVVDGVPSAAWGQAIGPTKLVIIPAAEFERLLLTQPAMGLKLCRVLAGKLRATADQLDAAIFLSARERVLCQLVRLAERHGEERGGSTAMSIRLTHQEIARLVGTARETVSRVLAELQDLQLLRFEERRMQIADLAALRKLAGVDAVDTRATRA